MAQILKLNAISPVAERTLGSDYTITDDCKNPVAALVRSFVMFDYDLPSSLVCVARAGAGVNNIPCSDYAKKGVIVFNTPGANANAVKELVIGALIASSRNMISGSEWAQSLSGDVKKQVEKGKSRFVGTEIQGKTIGILGLGAIGRLVSTAVNALGMRVVAYDPYISDEAKALGFVKIVNSADEVYASADYITLHIPYNQRNTNLICAETISKMKDGVIIINAARGEIVNTSDVKEAIKAKKVRAYYTDFPDADCLDTEGIIVTPHLGASSEEAEDNCAEMAARQIRHFVEEGTIENAVNMPPVYVPKAKAHRASVIYVGGHCFATTAVVTNKDGISYAIIESDEPIDIKSFEQYDGVIKARIIY